MAIGLDAAAWERIDALCEAGRMPCLAALRARGRSAHVHSEAVHFTSSVWPTFYAAAPSGEHGWYYAKLWRPDRMRLEYASPDWLPQSAFWDRLAPDHAIGVLDVPFVMSAPRAGSGFFVSGWQTHDRLGLAADSARHVRALRRRFGRAAMPPERFGPQSVQSLLALRRQVLAGLEQSAAAARWLLASRRWDLLLVVLGGVHRAGHYLWDLSQLDPAELSDRDRTLLEGALDEIYAAADRSLAAILEAAPADARVLVFALHGMQRNDGWADRFGDLVEAVRHRGGPATARHGLLYRLRRRVPWRLAGPVTQRLPFALSRWMLPAWSARMHDWSRTRFFALPCDVNGFLRVNLRGREAAGIVEPGRDYEQLLGELADAFLSFRSLETGEPIVREVARTGALEAASGARRPLLPDLIVRWNPVCAQDFSGVRSESCGTLRWEKGAPHPSGRSGNHAPVGWLTAAGPGIEPGGPLECDTLDLVPTLLHWLGTPSADEAQARGHAHGRAIPELSR